VSNLQLNDRGIAPLHVQSTASTHERIMQWSRFACQEKGDCIWGMENPQRMPFFIDASVG
jgi:hypothetical protein